MLYLSRVIHPRIKALTTYLINTYDTPRRLGDGRMIPPLVIEESLRLRTLKGLVRGHIK